MRLFVVLVITLLISKSVPAQEPSTEDSQAQFKTLSGMSVLGNNEAPKSLVIVPWKSSRIGDGIGVVDSLSNRPMPVDRDVFGRELHYYELRTGTGNQEAEDLRVGSRWQPVREVGQSVLTER